MKTCKFATECCIMTDELRMERC